MRRAVVDLASSRLVWRVPPSAVQEMRRAFGGGWEVMNVEALAASDGDGARASSEAVKAAAGAEVYLGWGISREVIQAARGTLRWAHTAAGGVAASLTPELVESGAALTNSRAVYAEPMADWAVAAIAFSVRGFHRAVDAQRRRSWDKDAFTDGSLRLIELSDTRVGIVGLGGIGRAIARRCHALGMQVHGIRRRASGRRPAGVSWVGGPGDLNRLARRSDVLIITAPHTVETDGLVDAELLAALPAGAFVLNLSRGALLDENALLLHLDSGHLGGCVLDVFGTEPLPVDHPLWDHPQVLVTPHVSAVSARFWERESALIVDNIQRYLAGRRLQNLVHLQAGY